MTQNTVSVFKCKTYHKLLFFVCQTYQYSNALSNLRLLLAIIIEFSVYDPCTYQCYLARRKRSGFEFCSGLSCYYLISASNCEDHSLKIHFNPQFKYKNFMYQHHIDRQIIIIIVNASIAHLLPVKGQIVLCGR